MQDSYSASTDSVFNLSCASLLEIGETKINTLWQAILKPVNYKAWIWPCRLLGSLERATMGVSSETEGGVTGSGQEHIRKKQGIYCL